MQKEKISPEGVAGGATSASSGSYGASAASGLYLSWAESWGYTLAFALTYSIEQAERCISEALASLVAADTERAKIAASNPASAVVRFAHAVWMQAKPEAFRIVVDEPFFRMPPIARAVVVLKARAKLSRRQIAVALDVSERQVEGHLQNGRALFSEGRAWCVSPLLATSSHGSEEMRHLDENPDLIFGRYLDRDLNYDQTEKVKNHLMACDVCRGNFLKFKKQYHGWESWVPDVELNQRQRKDLLSIVRLALRVQRLQSHRLMPTFILGLRRLSKDRQFWISVGLFATALLTSWVLQTMWSRHHVF